MVVVHRHVCCYWYFTSSLDPFLLYFLALLLLLKCVLFVYRLGSLRFRLGWVSVYAEKKGRGEERGVDMYERNKENGKGEGEVWGFEIERWMVGVDIVGRDQGRLGLKGAALTRQLVGGDVV